MIAHFHSLSAEVIERMRGGKAWKRCVRRLRPKFWQRTKCTIEKRTLSPPEGSGKGSGEGVLRGVLRRGPAVGFTVKMGFEKGSQKGF